MKLSEFYEKVFDWKIQHIPEMNYRFIETGGQGGINGGIIQPPHDGPWPGNMTFYINVDDPRGVSQARHRRGRQDSHRGADVFGMGAFSLFNDPEGRMLGLWKQAKKQ